MRQLISPATIFPSTIVQPATHLYLYRFFQRTLTIF